MARGALGALRTKIMSVPMLVKVCYPCGAKDAMCKRWDTHHSLAWFHLSMKLTVLDQYGKGLVHCDAVLGEEIREKLARLKWSMWHGNLYKVLCK